MKYKVGDKIKIKEIEDMEVIDGHPALTYGNDGSRAGHCSYTVPMEEVLKKLDNGRIITIKEILYMENQYMVEEIDFYWTDRMIECLAEDHIKSEPIDDRWEILDL